MPPNHPTSFTLVRDFDGGRQKLWRLDHPFTCSVLVKSGPGAFDFKRDENNQLIREDRTVTHVLSSRCLLLCTAIQGTPEVYIFPCSESGEVIDWTELPGSQKGTTDHTLVMRAFISSFSEN